jgi:hypothetical protein
MAVGQYLVSPGDHTSLDQIILAGLVDFQAVRSDFSQIPDAMLAEFLDGDTRKVPATGRGGTV